jgi:hypothetical protein
MHKAITRTVSAAGLILASTTLTVVVVSSSAAADLRPGGHGPAATVLAGGAEWG